MSTKRNLWWLLEKPILKSFCYDSTSSLAKTLMSRSRCFCFPLKTYTHGTTSPCSTADRRLLPSTWQVISLPLFWRKISKLWIFPAIRDRRWCHPSTRRLQMGVKGGLYIFEGKCRFENKPPPQSRSCLLLKKGGGGGGGGGGGLIFGRIL